MARPSQRGGSVERMMLSFQMGLNMGSGVALLVGVFLVYNTVSISVAQRRREIGTLRALGASRRRIRSLFTLEATVMGVLGTALGLPFGVGLARVAVATVSRSISSLYVHVNARDVQPGALELTLGVVLGVVGSAVAALWPAVRASQVQPVEALRRELSAGPQDGRGRWGPAAGGVLALALVWPVSLLPPPVENLPVGGYAAVFMVVFGVTLLSPRILQALRGVFARPGEWLLGISGRMAADNFARAPARTAVPVSALAIGLGMVVCIAGFIGSFQRSSDAWIDQSVPADLFVTSSSRVAGIQNSPMDPSLAEGMASLPGVRFVDRVRILAHDFSGLRILIVSFTQGVREGRTIQLEGHAPSAGERAEGGVNISENLSKRRQLHPGDSFSMATPTGLRTYRVTGVVVDYTSDQGTVFLDRARFLQDFGDERVDTFEVYLTDLSHAESVRRAITERYGQKYDLFVLTNAELRREAHDLVEGAFSVTYAMEAVAVLLALLGVINTLLAAVLDRTREVGLLRAVGASRGHVVRLFAGEAAFMGVSGGFLGVGMGVAMGMVLIKVIGSQATGWTFPYLFPWRLALALVTVATVCAVGAGLYPARRAALLDVVEALAYE